MEMLAFIQSINNFAKGDMVTAIGLAVLVIGIGGGISAKIDGRTGAFLMISGFAFIGYVLYVNGIFRL